MNILKLIIKILIPVIAGALVYFLTDAPGMTAEVAVADFLATAACEKSLTWENDVLNRIKKNGPPSSLIRDIELRTEIDRFENYEQSFGLQVKLKGWDEIKWEKKEYQTGLDKSKIRKEILFRNALLDRYHIVIEYFHQNRLLQSYEQLLLVNQDQTSLLEQNMGAIDFDIKKVMDAEQKKISLEYDIMGIKNKIRLLEKEIGKWISSQDVISFSDSKLVSMEKIMKTVSGMDLEDDSSDIFLKQMKLDAKRAGIEYQKEKSKPWLSFVRLSWDMDEKDDAYKAASVEFGISLPWFGERDDVIQEKRITAMIEQNKVNAAEIEQQEKRTALYGKMMSLIDQYELLTSNNVMKMKKGWKQTVEYVGNDQPDLLLFLRRHELEQEIYIINAAHEILEAYIEYLDLSGKISKAYPVNFLSDDLEEISW